MEAASTATGGVPRVFAVIRALSAVQAEGDEEGSGGGERRGKNHLGGNLLRDGNGSVSGCDDDAVEPLETRVAGDDQRVMRMR